MGGLQRNVIERSQLIHGRGEVYFPSAIDHQTKQRLKEQLAAKDIAALIGLRYEVLARRGDRIVPIIAHGLSSQELPAFLQERDFKEMILGADAALKLSALPGEAIQLISPAHVTPLFRDVPLSRSFYLDGVYRAHVPEADMFHTWVALDLMQNLIGARQYNYLRFDSDFSEAQVKNVLNAMGFASEHFRLRKWEEAHQTLVWALRLETSVMIFLFIAMTILVSLCIVSGSLLFFDKVQLDLASFWILGASKKSLAKATRLFFVCMSFGAVLTGLILGAVFLVLLEHFGGELLPAVFVDRQVPVFYTLKSFLIAFFTPLMIGLIFMIWVLNSFKNKIDYLDKVRSVG